MMSSTALAKLRMAGQTVQAQPAAPKIVGKLKHSRALRMQWEIHAHYLRVLGIRDFQQTLVAAFIGAAAGGTGRGSLGSGLCYTPAYLPPKPETLGVK